MQSNTIKSYEKRWYGLAVLSLVLTIISIDNSVLDVALPAISKTLSASAKDLQWLMDSYILVFTSLLLTFGAISDRYGRKMMLQIGVLIFGLASLGAALSDSILELNIYRGLSGFGASMMMPSTLSLITDMFQDKQERQKAFAIWGMMFGIGFGLGPLMGGWLVDHFGWEAIFYINLPIVLIAFVLGQFWLRESKDTLTPSADFIGMLLSTISLFLLVFGIIEAGQYGWSNSVVVLNLIGALLFMGIFLLFQLKSSAPMLPLFLFKNPSFSVASLTLTLAMFGLMGTMFFFSQYFQTIQAYSALEAGLLLVPITIGITLSSALAPKVLVRYGMKSSVTWGLLISSFALGLFAYFIDLDTSKYIVILGFFLLGFGFGLAMVPATDSIMGAIPESKLGVGSAMNDTTRELGGALSIAILGSLVNNHYIQSIRTSTLDTKTKEIVEQSIQAAHLSALEHTDKTIISIADSAFVHALSYSLSVGTFIILLSALITYLYLPDEIKMSKI